MAILSLPFLKLIGHRYEFPAHAAGCGLSFEARLKEVTVT